MESVFLDIFIKSREKAEKMLKNKTCFKIQQIRGIRIFFLTFFLAILAVAVMIFTHFLPNTTLTILLITEGIIAAFALLSLFAYLNAKFNYYVVSEENIVHHRLFGKNNTIEYSDIFYILYRNKGDYLTAYNRYGTILFHLESAYIGIERLTDILEEKGIRHETSEIITEEMINSEEYQLNQRKSKRETIMIFAIMAIVITVIILLGFYWDGKQFGIL